MRRADSCCYCNPSSDISPGMLQHQTSLLLPLLLRVCHAAHHLFASLSFRPALPQLVFHTPSLQVTKKYDRFAIENYVHWGVTLVAGGWVRPIPIDLETVTSGADCGKAAWRSTYKKQACADLWAGSDGTGLHAAYCLGHPCSVRSAVCRSPGRP